ncbi:putative disease resistance protein RGA1 [Musa acuminata AAA Group]|uniref:putative disease resistance protein RGA1 n=1 Tax=Musa acuminata AAA Group TaxID=214697 RepID=UPI0031CE936D
MDFVGVGKMMVGEWFAGYFVDKLLNMVSSHFADNRDLLVGVEEKLKDLQARLPRIQAVINAAEGRPIRDAALANWMRELKDAAYEADDILDEFEYRELHDQLQDRSKVSALAASALRFLKNLFVSDDDLKRLMNLLGDLDKICLDINNKKLELDEYKAKQNNETRETSSFTQEVVFGRDKERDKILHLLLSTGAEPDFGDKGAGSSSHPSLGVLPIVGIGGVGKTSLAQLIYNDQRIAHHFEFRKWVYVSHDSSVKKISRELESNLAIDSRPREISLDTQLGKLMDATRNKRFLFVLDDVWDETGSKWRELRSVLTSGARGSFILVTTQSPLVAEIMGTIDPIKLDVLEEEDYWRLFEHCAIGDKELDPELRRKLQSLGHQISKKLHGLPLAGKALGSLLRSKLEEEYWKTILESEWWEHDFVLDNILPSLGLSYQHLSSNLKQCFAYTSIFPKGHIFEKERLVHMWIAQGFIQPRIHRGRMTLEDIGSQIFDELTSRYFFLSTVTNGYVMHDLIRDLAVYVSLDECCVVNDEPAKIPPTVRHITLRAAKLVPPGEVCKFQKLRTLIFYHDYNCEEFLSSEGKSSEELYEFLKEILENMKNLRVLDVSYSHMGIKKVPDAICDLSHLRYLDVSCTKIRQLPGSFSKICHLQVLNLKWCRFKKLPEGMNRLIKLRHLYADAETISLIDGIGKLTDLQGLEEFHVTRKRGHQIGELKELRNLRKRLVIKNLDNVGSKEEAMEVKLNDKVHLNEITFDGQGDMKTDILDGLEPHYNLKNLSIQRYGGTNYPSWLEKNQYVTNLESICLDTCARWVNLPPLGQLPFLKDLSIRMMPSIRRIGIEFYGNAAQIFPSLKCLKFLLLKEWVEWSDVDGRPILPRLLDLRIEDGQKLTRMPVLPLSSMTALRLQMCGDIGNALPEYMLSLTSLVSLDLVDYLHRTSVCLSNLRALKHLSLYQCPELSLINGFQSLVNLKILTVEKCPKLIKPSSQREQRYVEQDLRSLSSVTIEESILNNVWVTLGRIPSLQGLRINYSSLAYFEMDQEEWFQQLTSVKLLHLMDCPNLQKLPDLEIFSSLENLTIGYCPNVQSMPENGLPILLKELHIWECTKLRDRCKKDDGPDWPKIAHVPYIIVDSKIIQML